MADRIDLEAEIVKLLDRIRSGQVDPDTAKTEVQCYSLIVKVREAEGTNTPPPGDGETPTGRLKSIEAARAKAQGRSPA